MHNGCLAHFSKIKKRLIAGLSENCFSLIHGTTDTEHAFAIFISHLPDENPHVQHSIHVLKEAMLNTIQDLLKLTMLCGEKPEASSMNFAVSNGEVVIATRFRNSHREEPPSLYISKTVRYECPNSTDQPTGACPVSAVPSSPRLCTKDRSSSIDLGRSCDSLSKVKSVVICSEPLSYNEDQWALVPKNHLLIVTANHKIKVESIQVDPKYMIQAFDSTRPLDVLPLKSDVFNLKITRTSSFAAISSTSTSAHAITSTASSRRTSKADLSNSSGIFDDVLSEELLDLRVNQIVRSSTVELLTPRLCDEKRSMDTDKDQTRKTEASDLTLNFQVAITRDSIMKMLSIFVIIQVAVLSWFVY